MKKILGIGVVILLALMIASASHKDNDQKQTIKNNATITQEEPLTDNEEKVFKNLSYGPHRRNTMNVIVPKGSSESTPFVLFIHGGAWSMGDKNDFALAQAALAQEGIASASMNYRYVSPSLHYEALMDDIGLAIDFTVSRQEAWGIDTSNIAIGGISAGAHMSLLYAYRYDRDNRITAIIDLAGPTDLTDSSLLEAVAKTPLIQGLNNMVGVPYRKGTELDERFALVSPINYVKDIPVLLVHGTADSLVPFSQATKLRAVLEEKNIPYKLVPVSNADHDLGIARPDTIKMILEEMTKWILEYED